MISEWKFMKEEKKIYLCYLWTMFDQRNFTFNFNILG